MFHLGAFYESLDPAGAFVKVKAVQDQAINVQGDDLRIPEDLSKLVAAAAMSDTPVVTPQARLTSPSLRRVSDHYISPASEGAESGDVQQIEHFGDTPIGLTPNESLNFEILANPAAATAQTALVWLADGPLTKVSGEVRTVRLTAAITLAAGTWVNGGMTFDQVLAAGDYDVVGMRAMSANGIAARLVFIGGKYRPGVVMNDASSDYGSEHFRYGRSGSFGRFHTTTPPSVDVLGSTDTSEVVFLDIVKVS